MLTSLSVISFLLELQKMPKDPTGKLERSEAPKIQTSLGTSSGKKTNRLRFDELKEDCFKVAIYDSGCFFRCGDYKPALIKIDGQREVVLVNIKSMMKRFDLPRDVIFNNLSNLGKVIRLVQEKCLFQNPSSFLVNLEMVAKMAEEQNRCFRLSKRCYHLANSIDVYPGGFIAIDGEHFGGGGRARVKTSTTLQGTHVARRSFAFRNVQEVLRLMKIFNEFKGKPGILDTLAMGVYENKKGQCKFVSFHPLYDQNLIKTYKNRPLGKDRLKMAHELLQGLNTIAEKGLHRDLSFANIFLRTRQVFEAVIADLEYFQYHDERNDWIMNPNQGPENRGIKREVWDLGNALYYVLQPDSKCLPWDRSLCGEIWIRNSQQITQENLDKHMTSCNFPPELKSLLRRMLAIDPRARWTAKQSLEYFEKYLWHIDKINDLNDVTI